MKEPYLSRTVSFQQWLTDLNNHPKQKQKHLLEPTSGIHFAYSEAAIQYSLSYFVLQRTGICKLAVLNKNQHVLEDSLLCIAL